MANTTTQFRCYYEDGTITASDYCQPINDNGSPLINTEFDIIEKINQTTEFPWLLVILAMMALLSKNKKG
jgi:hypothetical protein